MMKTAKKYSFSQNILFLKNSCLFFKNTTSIVACMTNIMRGKASSLGKLNMSTQAGCFPQFLGQRLFQTGI